MCLRKKQAAKWLKNIDFLLKYGQSLREAFTIKSGLNTVNVCKGGFLASSLFFVGIYWRNKCKFKPYPENKGNYGGVRGSVTYVQCLHFSDLFCHETFPDENWALLLLALFILLTPLAADCIGAHAVTQCHLYHCGSFLLKVGSTSAIQHIGCKQL